MKAQIIAKSVAHSAMLYYICINTDIITRIFRGVNPVFWGILRINTFFLPCSHYTLILDFCRFSSYFTNKTFCISRSVSSILVSQM